MLVSTQTSLNPLRIFFFFLPNLMEFHAIHMYISGQSQSQGKFYYILRIVSQCNTLLSNSLHNFWTPQSFWTLVSVFSSQWGSCAPFVFSDTQSLGNLESIASHPHPSGIIVLCSLLCPIQRQLSLILFSRFLIVFKGVIF